ncbi:MAG: efflux RND transporter permease subunit [Planctomycetota bacterium]
MNMGIAAFGVRKPVVVNLLMAAILITGIVSGLNLRKQFFPEVDADTAVVNLPYPGAAPEEVEESLAIKVEDAFDNIEAIDELITTVAEGGGGITIRFKEGADVDAAMDDVERAIDGLQDLPGEADEITSQLIEPRMPVIRLAVHGPMEPAVLKQAIRTIRDDLRELPGMGEVLIGGVRDYELQVDVDELAMLEYGLSLPTITDTIRAWMTDIPGGTVKTDTGNVSLRTLGTEERTQAIEAIPLFVDNQGRAIHVRDVATVREAFVEEDVRLTYSGEPSADITIFKTGNQDIVHIARMVRAYADGRSGRPYTVPAGERLQKQMARGMTRPGEPVVEYKSPYEIAWEKGAKPSRPLPDNATVGTATDLARFVEGRLDLLTRNAIYGAFLVFGTLLLFLNWRVALWVGAGLVTAIAGTLLLMGYLGITLNLLTMFGLIVVMGLLVDDAIVVAENIQTHHDKKGESPTDSSIAGTNEVFWPVVATVLTSIVAFLPLTFIKGQIGTLLGALPLVVACALAMSLVESLLILPSHMGHSLTKRDKAKPNKLSRLLRRYEDGRDRIIMDKIAPGFARLLGVALRFRYLTLCVALMALFISFGLVAGKRVGFVFMSSDDSESVMVNIRLPIGTPIDQTQDAVDRIERAVLAQEEVKFVETIVGASSDIETGQSNGASSHIAQMFIELTPVEDRDTPGPVVIDNIRRELLGKVDDVERMSFEQMAGGPGGPDITIRLSSDDPETLRLATAEVREALAGYPQLFDIADDANQGRQEIKVSVNADAQAMGLNNLEVNRQLRGFLFGLDAHTYADREEDIDVRVRIDKDTRTSLVQVQNAWLINALGVPVPMRELVDIDTGSSFASINRVDGQRAVTVTASVEQGTSPEDITAALKAGPKDENDEPILGPDDKPLPNLFDKLEAKYPGLTVGFSGRQEQMADAFSTLPLGFGLAMLLIYVILAWLFQSYFQPILVMCVIPFATIGLIWGHYILGFDITFLSLIGFVALSGIVVNDSLILVQFYNQRREAGDSVYDALVAAGQARLRAIFLTTVTTVLGLLPLITEQSFQARFLIPMGISIAAGLISATVMILVVLPCIMLVFDDLKRTLYFLWHGTPRPADFKPEGVSAGTG